MGHLASQPEIKKTKGGHTVTTFSVATNRGWGSKDDDAKPTADFHKIVAWRKLGEACGEYLKKGSSVYVEGYLSQNKYLDKEGKNRKSTEVVADLVNFISVKRNKDAIDEVNVVDLSKNADLVDA